ncbi:SusC/RagA family TonB-linked outer membrane protein [Aquimarina agarivorans]|uniref:SusC/RagA family TonB-linked outer membrane protein n=1 Tax=Aquimarina agarivorans TaxID=980584 RepID=UPI000248FC75|nr:TonB-dependent receptor [Aquimarina agarivorans]
MKKLLNGFVYPFFLSKLDLKVNLSFLFIAIAFIEIHANVFYSQQTKISLDFDNITVNELINEIEKTTEFRFIYKIKDVDLNRSLQIKVKDKLITAILEEVFGATKTSFRVLDRQIFLTKKKLPTTSKTLKSTVISKMNQQFTITGTVKDESNQPLPGVDIMVAGTSTGTSTNFDGEYMINAAEGDVLLFTYIGFVDQRITVGTTKVINVNLVEDLQELEQVVVIGYGTQKKSLLTGAITSIGKKALNNNTFTRAEQVLQGRTPGVYIVPNSGSPGASPNVRIRGISTNGNSDPLYIVDGLRTRDIGSIDPSDIENMEVLKDAASSAIYGAEGGNGVIIITTKKGKVGREELTFSSQYIVNTLQNNPDRLNAEQYVTYYGTEGQLYPDIALTGFDTNWTDELFETGFLQRNNLSYSKGSERSKVHVSASILNQDGIVATNKDEFKRYTIRLNGEHQFKNWLKIGNNISYIRSERSTIRENDQTNGVISSALALDPLTPAVYPNEASILPTTRNAIGDNFDLLLRNEDGLIFGNSPYNTSMNPLARIASTDGITKVDRILGSVFGEFKLFESLKFTSRFSIDSNVSNEHSWIRQFFYNPNHRGDVSSVREENDFNFFWQWENFLSFNKSFGEHNVDVVLGTSAQKAEFRTTISSGAPLALNDERYSEFDFVANQDLSFVAGNFNTSTQGSYFGRLQYNYKDKYLLQGTIRRDAASTFFLPADNKWGTFPSFSAGWVVSEENFFSTDAVVNFLKLRGSWGENGSLSNLGNFSYFGFLTSQNLNYTDSEGNLLTAIEPSRLDNFDLTWETSQQVDFGLDMRLLNNKLTFTMDYYKKTTKDLLTPNTPPLEAGNEASFINAGNVENKGFEFSLGYKDHLGDFNYGISVNLSTLDNEVTFLNPTLDRLAGTTSNGNWISTWVEEGFPLWYFRGFKTDGIDPQTGDPIFVDTDGEDGITAADQTYIGDPHPDIIYGGTLSLGYKNIDLNIFVQGVAGNEILNGLIRSDIPGQNLPVDWFSNRWTPTNTNASRPRANYSGNGFQSDLLVEDGSYFKIRQIQLGYTLPKSLTQTLAISKIRTYISLENYFTFTKYTGLDPELGASTANSIGVDKGFYPNPRSFIFGATVSF